jgi:mono/diheme cytochrome c family protein
MGISCVTALGQHPYCPPTRQYVAQQNVIQQGYTVQGYNNGYNGNYTHYQHQTINYPVVIGVPLSDLGINYYFSVTPQKREERIVEQVAKEIISNMNKNGYGILMPVQVQQQTTTVQQTVPVEQAQQQAQQQPGPATGQMPIQQMPIQGSQPQQAQMPIVGQPNQQVDPVQIQQQVADKFQILSLFQKKCLGCHKPGEIKNNVKLFNSDGSLVDSDLSTRMDILNSVLRKEGVTAMPPSQPLTADEKRIVINWIQEKL